MIECGSVRWPLISTRPIGFSATGTEATGIHHASRMLASIAPARIAIRRPSPVLVSIDTGCDIGPRRNARHSSGSHSKPPEARITPRGARTSAGPSGVSKAAPTTTPSSVSSSRADQTGPRLDAAVETSREAGGRSVLGRSRARCAPARRASSSADGGSGTALPSGVSLIVMCGVGEVRRRRDAVVPTRRARRTG